MNKLLLLLLLSGCSATPSWTNATKEQREFGLFRADANYLNSLDYTNSIKQSVDTVERLKKQ